MAVLSVRFVGSWEASFPFLRLLASSGERERLEELPEFDTHVSKKGKKIMCETSENSRNQVFDLENKRPEIEKLDDEELIMVAGGIFLNGREKIGIAVSAVVSGGIAGGVIGANQHNAPVSLVSAALTAGTGATLGYSVAGLTKGIASPERPPEIELPRR
jgi:hypothetical protein